MDIRQLTPELSVSPQIQAMDVVKLKAAGFRAIICNRADGEGSDQPLFNDIELAAQQAGLEAHYLPAESGKVTDEQGRAFGKLLSCLPKPVFAYCLTGMRSTTMWTLSEFDRQPLPQNLETAQKAGFDLKGVVRRIANKGRTPADADHWRRKGVLNAIDTWASRPTDRMRFNWAPPSREMQRIRMSPRLPSASAPSPFCSGRERDSNPCLSNGGWAAGLQTCLPRRGRWPQLQ